MQPFADDGDDFLAATTATCLSMTLTVGLGMAIPTADPNVRWMLEALAITVSVYAFLLGIYQLIVDLKDEFTDNKDIASACCGGSKTDSDRVADDVASLNVSQPSQ
jgi:hypothetical protein